MSSVIYRLERPGPKITQLDNPKYLPSKSKVQLFVVVVVDTILSPHKVMNLYVISSP